MMGPKLAIVAQVHDAQPRGHDAPDGRPDRAQQQDLCASPKVVGKVRRDCLNPAKIGLGQGEHGQFSWSSVAVAYPGFSLVHIG